MSLDQAVFEIVLLPGEQHFICKKDLEYPEVILRAQAVMPQVHKSCIDAHIASLMDK